MALNNHLTSLSDYDIYLILNDKQGKPTPCWSWVENERQILERRRDLTEIKDFFGELEEETVFIPRRLRALIRGMRWR